MKSWCKYLVYISLLFLVIALYNANYLTIPQIFFPAILIMSFIFLFAGFFGNVLSWQQVLKESDYDVGLDDCLAGFGLSIFAKYIPGKVWMIMGRAAYIAKKRPYSLSKLSTISLNAQFIALWVGLCFGAIGLLLLGGQHLWGWLTFFLWLCLTVLIFSKLVHGFAEHLIGFMLRRDIKIPCLTLKSTLTSMPWFVLNWFFWSIGFYLLVASLTPMDVSWQVGLGFPLAASLGIMSIIAPGGLGTREGVMVGYLMMAEIPLAEATAIAIAARLWFLVGDAFIFIVGWMTHRGLHETLLSGGLPKVKPEARERLLHVRDVEQ